MECVSGYNAGQGQDAMDIKKGPWSPEEDQQLFNYITKYGDGRWNTLARCAGLKRTGKSCRLRWLNYLRPDVRRGNITFQEQLLILQLHSHWGNRWSKIAQYLPGRTDNEIKNYWRTRVQKQAKQLKCEVNSQQFRDAMRCVWIPRLTERIQAESESLNHLQRAVVSSSSQVCCGGYASTPTSCDSSETSARIFSDSGLSTQTQYRSVCGPEFGANGRNDYSVGGASVPVESNAWSDVDICFDDLDVLLGFE